MCLCVLGPTSQLQPISASMSNIYEIWKWGKFTADHCIDGIIDYRKEDEFNMCHTWEDFAPWLALDFGEKAKVFFYPFLPLFYPILRRQEWQCKRSSCTAEVTITTIGPEMLRSDYLMNFQRQERKNSRGASFWGPLKDRPLVGRRLKFCQGQAGKTNLVNFSSFRWTLDKRQKLILTWRRSRHLAIIVTDAPQTSVNKLLVSIIFLLSISPLATKGGSAE